MKIIKWLDQYAEAYLSGILLFFIILCGFIQVVFRFLLHAPLAWSEEYILFMFIWLNYIGAAAALRYDKHIAVTSLMEKLPPRLQKLELLLVDVLWVVFIVVILYCTWPVFMMFYSGGSKTVAAKIPYWTGYLSILVGMALMGIRMVQQIILHIKDFKREEGGDGVCKGQ